VDSFLLYGSYGYTGGLIAALAVQNGLRPLLAGRDERRLHAQGAALGLDYRAFPLEDTRALRAAVEETPAVLHCAGPFVHTFRQMAQACLAARRHYVDISGEIPGFEALARLDQEARQAGVMLLPGAGFDVVPTDCLAAHLKKRLPTATHLRLFIRSVGGGVSQGTARSAIENMQRGGMIRRNGDLVNVPPAWHVRQVDFEQKPIKVVSIGWGDVSTAFYSTGIPNIETYMALPASALFGLRLLRKIGPLVYTRPVKMLLKQALQLTKTGPGEEERQRGFNLIVGEAVNADGQTASSRLRTPEGYSFTALATVEILRRILRSDFKPGFQTPSTSYGSDFILGFSGVERFDL